LALGLVLVFVLVLLEEAEPNVVGLVIDLAFALLTVLD
jgi:hypothetical protein